MFTVLSGVLSMGNIDIEVNDDGQAVIPSGPGTMVRTVAVGTLLRSNPYLIGTQLCRLCVWVQLKPKWCARYLCCKSPF